MRGTRSFMTGLILATLAISLALAMSVVPINVAVAMSADDPLQGDTDSWLDEMGSHHGSMHGDDFEEHHKEMYGENWEEHVSSCRSSSSERSSYRYSGGMMGNM